MKYDFIEIGTSYFSTIIETVNENTVGISIEPIKHYLDRLPDKKNVKKINAAISNYNGTGYIYYIPDTIIKKYNLPDWLVGCASIDKPHKSINREIQWVNNLIDPILTPINIDIKELVIKQEVPVINFYQLILDNNITEIDYLKIDAEGHDTVILKDYLDICETDNSLYAAKIEFETNELSSEADKKAIIDKMVSVGYKITNRAYEITLVRNKNE